jgi:cardiolipin synthase
MFFNTFSSLAASAPFVGLLLIVYWITVVLVIISQNREPSLTLAWILVLMALPGFGLILYFFAGRDWHSITAKRDWLADLRKIRTPFMHGFYARYAGRTDQLKQDLQGNPAARVVSTIEKVNDAPPLPAHDVTVYPSGEEYFPVLIDDIYKAQRFVHMQYFIWERDELTTKICDALMDRVKAGVEVRILNDYIGNIQYKKDQLKALENAGAKIGSDVTQIGKLNYRNHRKITVIDGELGHTGGFNIGQEYIDGQPKYPTWRDTGLRFRGPAVGEMQKLFADRWYEVYRESLFNPMYFPAEGAPVAENGPMLQVVAQGVEDYWSSATRAHEVAIMGARRRAWIQSPYWVPDPGMLDALVNASLGGIDLKFMMTGWPDKKIAFRTAQSYWKPILEAGGEIYLYMEGFFHAKGIVIDSEIGSLGTMNLDMRSLHLHKELMVWMYDVDLAKRQEEIFLADLAKCRQVTLDEVNSWSSYKRFMDSMSRLASNLL